MLNAQREVVKRIRDRGSTATNVAELQLSFQSINLPKSALGCNDILSFGIRDTNKEYFAVTAGNKPVQLLGGRV